MSTSYWRIFDLTAPDQPPVTVAPEHWAEAAVHGWGPGDRFAALISDKDRSPSGFGAAIAITDGRTGTTTLVDLEQGLTPYYEEGLVWTADGGVLVGTPTEWTTTLDGELLDDGSLRVLESPVLDDGTGGRRFKADGTRLETRPAPQIVRPRGATEFVEGLGDPLAVEDIVWATDEEAMWVVTTGPQSENLQLVLSRMAPEEAPSRQMQLDTAMRYTSPDAGASATFFGLAPDDSMIVLGMVGRTGGPTLVLPDARTERQVEGSFVGWLPMDWATR